MVKTCASVEWCGAAAAAYRQDGAHRPQRIPAFGVEVGHGCAQLRHESGGGMLQAGAGTFLPGEKRPLGVNMMIEGGAKGKSSVNKRAPW